VSRGKIFSPPSFFAKQELDELNFRRCPARKEEQEGRMNQKRGFSFPREEINQAEDKKKNNRCGHHDPDRD
jgi:hypothetical protein